MMPVAPTTHEPSGSGESIPDVVIATFNMLAARHFDGRHATISQEDVITELANAGITREVVLEKGYLNAGFFFQDAGWIVKYDKPGYDKSCPACIHLTRRNPR